MNETNSAGSEGGNSSETNNCSLLALLPFSDHNYGGNYPDHMSDFGFTHMAAVLLAVDHFNARDTAVVPELEQLGNCSVQLPTPVFVNTNGLTKDTVQFLVNVNKGDFCGIVGPYKNSPTLAAANFALGLEIPLLSHGCYDIQLSGQRTYPLTGRTVTQIYSLSEVAITFMQHHGRYDYLSTIAPVNEDGHQYRTSMDQKVKLAGFRSHNLYTYQPTLEHTFQPNQGIGYAIQKTKESGYRNIFFTMFHVGIQLPLFADFAEQFNMLNGEYLWMMGGEVDFDEVLELASTNSNVSKLVRGMMSVRWLDGFDFDPKNDRMLKAWRVQNVSFVDRLNELHPVVDVGDAGYYHAGPGYFQTRSPQRGAGFAYDAVMSMGFGKCKELEERGRGPGGRSGNNGDGDGNANIFHDQNGSDNHDDGGNENSSDRESRQEGARQRRRRVKGEKWASTNERGLQKKQKAQVPLNPHLKGIVNSGFQGATGTVLFGNGTTHYDLEFPGNRKKQTLQYGVYNFRATDGLSASENPLK